MKKTSIIFLISSGLMINSAIAIDPMYEGENAIRSKVFQDTCLQCHSSILSGLARNGAPPSVNFDTYPAAFAQRDAIIDRAVTRMNMPPGFSNIPKLNNEQKQALTNWQALKFPEKTLPPIYYSDTEVLKMPLVYIMSPNGKIESKVSADMALIPNQQPIQFELIELHQVSD